MILTTESFSSQITMLVSDKEKIVNLNLMMSALSFALKLLSRKDYSVSEIEEKLRNANFAESDINKTVEKLKNYGYLNDEKFSLLFIESKTKKKPVGKELLAHQLRKKKVTNETIEKTLSNLDENELIAKAIEKRLSLRGKPKNLNEAKKLYDYLIRQGFSADLVTETLQKMQLIPDDPIS